MNVTVHIPDDLASRLTAAGGDLSRRILEDPNHQPAGAVAISARTGAGFEALLKKIDDTLALDAVTQCTFRIPAALANSVCVRNTCSTCGSVNPLDRIVLPILRLNSANPPPCTIEFVSAFLIVSVAS